MKHKKLLFLTMVLLILASLAMTNMPVHAASPTVRMYVNMSSGYIPGAPAGTYVMVDVYIETDIVDNTEDGIVQWALSAKVDPAVLEPMMARACLGGYFLYDFIMYWGYDWDGFATGPLMYTVDKTDGTINWMTEGITGPYPIPAGAGGSGKLVTLRYRSLSETDYSLIDLFYEIDVDAWYWAAWDTTAENPIAVDVVEDGHYNLPENAYVFETPAGGTFPTANPMGTDWHELEPTFCQDWSLESWNDNGDGKLSASDQVDMQRPTDPEPIWFHVEWVNPTPVAGDGLADMWVTDKAVPEFPLGSVAPIALIAAVAYIWWVTRRKRQEAV